MRQEGSFPWINAIALYPIVFVGFIPIALLNADKNWGGLGWQKGIPQAFCISNDRRAYLHEGIWEGPGFFESFTH